MFRRALVSVSDKAGLLEALRPLAARGMEIVSTGGTARHLREAGLKVTDVSEVTGFPEVMDGRVKTLHPHVHMGLLAREQDALVLKEHHVQRFDLVIVNLYPFAQALASGKKDEALIEMIDVGGPSMLRAAAKNFELVTVIVDPADYALLAGPVDLEQRQALAAKVFQTTAECDRLIGQALMGDLSWSLPSPKLHQTLRYGENPHQKAQWYRTGDKGLHCAEVLQGKELSFNNLRDLQAATECVRLFQEPTAVFVKHGNPCGVASRSDLNVAIQQAISADPVSVFGGIGSFNRKVTGEMAQQLTQVFLECVIAPDWTGEALQILGQKKNLRVLKWPEISHQNSSQEFFSVEGGVLVQDKDLMFDRSTDWKILGKSPDSAQMQDLLFAEKVAGQLKSNSIVIASQQTTRGLGMGQVNRVDSVEQAIQRWKKHHSGEQDVVLASDAFFPFPDSIELLAQAGIRWVLQPGGALRDEEVCARAEQLGVQMILSQRRHFKH